MTHTARDSAIRPTLCEACPAYRAAFEDFRLAAEMGELEHAAELWQRAGIIARQYRERAAKQAILSAYERGSLSEDQARVYLSEFGLGSA